MKRPFPILAVALCLAAVASRPAWAEERVVRYYQTEEYPNSYMLGSGLAVFGISYGAAAIVGSSSPRTQDQTLLVPLIGPWLNLTNRPTCGTSAACNDENTAKVLLVVGGVFQGLGALTFVASFFNPEERRVRRVVRTGVTIVPAPMGVGGSGVMAVGRF
jgi:hypothetical protein